MTAINPETPNFITELTEDRPYRGGKVDKGLSMGRPVVLPGEVGPALAIATRGSRVKTGNIKKWIAGGVVAGILASGAVALEVATNKSAGNHIDKVELTDMRERNAHPEALNEVVVFGEGTQFYTAPMAVEQDNQGDVNSVAGTVPKGEVLRINRPTYVDHENGTTWLAFSTLEKGQLKNQATDAKNTYWIPLPADNTGVQVYDFPEVTDAFAQGKSPELILPLSTDKAGNFVVEGHDDARMIGIASSIPKDIFYQQMVVNEQLTART